MSENRVDFKAGKTQVRVTYLSPDLVRITHSMANVRSIAEEHAWIDRVLLPQPEVSMDAVGVRATIEHGCLILRGGQDQVCFAEAQPTEVYSDGLRLVFCMARDELFYGGGAWFNGFAHQTDTVELVARESPAGTQDVRTYSAFPYFLSNKGYAVLLLNSYRCSWNFDARAGVVTIEAAGQPADYVVIFGKTPAEILTHYSALTGRPPLLPRWAFGLWVMSFPAENQFRVVELAEQHRQGGIPLDAIVLDYAWQERYNNFNWRASLFPQPHQMLSELKKYSVRLGLSFTPFLQHTQEPVKRFGINLATHNLAVGTEKDDERVPEEFELARSMGFLAHEDVALPCGRGGMIDFTNPEAVEWWNQMLRALYQMGVAFFKHDGEESLPEDGHNQLGMDGREAHNLYGFFSGKAIYDGMVEMDDRRPLAYSRSVWAGSQRYPALFLGDQKPSFVSMQRTMRAGLNMSLAGFAYWTAHGFGLEGRTTPETHMRYAQWSLLNPLASYILRPERIDHTRFPWSHEAAVKANFQKFSELRYCLLPYYCQLAWQAYRSGLPIVRPMLLEFPEDARMWKVDDQAMIGPMLLAAPVLEAGATSRSVVLPQGNWFDFWSGESYVGGGTVTLLAEKDSMPLLVRGGCVLPMVHTMDSIADEHEFERLEFHFWPPFASQTVFVEEDGRTRAYTRGEVSVFSLGVREVQQMIQIAVTAYRGNYHPKHTTKTMVFILYQVTEAQGVEVHNGGKASWYYDQERKQMVISTSWKLNDILQITLKE